MAKNDNKEIIPAQEKEIIEIKATLASKQGVLLQIGQIQAFNFMSKLLTVSELKVLQEVKQSKSYKGLTYPNEQGELLTVSTWDECCQHIIGGSRSNIDDRLLNLEKFGEEFYESSQQIGLGYRDLRALRQLPEDEQSLIIDSEAVELGDKEAVKELIEDLTAKHKKEKKQLKEKVSTAEAQLKASREMSNETAVKLQAAQEKLAARRFGTDKWQADVKDFFATMNAIHNGIYEGLNQLLELNERLEFTQVDELAKDSASAAFYADNKLMVEQVALTWNQIYRTWAHVAETAKPSSELLAELGFEGMEAEE